ncbi:DeoR/GlpR family DNA-binding transcription regulator [Nocardioides sp.]|uniref:DeoR/GlpR family DNA-binding transcription regulator n=1 Tax=Nocardioides sp. TaxID=35761 RepID=UPI002621F1FD|nr:DeoR/GlpR family DNA-binding transcription regulator [uncultured Nocardioides sp.]
MYAAERHQAIADLVNKRNRVSVTELAAHFDVTTETVRRDLSTLERLKLVRRVHGGAVSIGSLTVLEAKLPERGLEHADEKDAIARAALELLPAEGGTLVLDAGTTTVRLAELLPTDRRWTVLTNAVPIAALLAPAGHVELQLLPGRVRTTTQAAVGHATIEALGHFRADLAFVGTNGLTVAHGFSTPDPEEAATKHAMVLAAQRVVALADSSKVGQERTVRFARIDEVDVLVTDPAIDAADLQQLEVAGLEVVRAS